MRGRLAPSIDGTTTMHTPAALLLRCLLLCALSIPLTVEAQSLATLGVATKDGRLDLDATSTLLDNGIMNFDRARYSKAMALAEQELAPGRTPDARTFAIAARLHLLGDLERGKAIVERGLEAFPKYAPLHELRVSYALREQSPMALEYAANMQKLLPTDPITHRVQGRLALDQRVYEAAANELQAATAAGPQLNPAWTYDMLGRALEKLRRFDEGLAARKRAHELAPEDPWIAANLAANLINFHGKFDEAATLADRSLALLDYPNIKIIRANAEYGRWALAWTKAPDSPDTAKALASARTRQPDLLRAFQNGCDWPGTKVISISLLRAKLVPASEIDRADNLDNTCLRNAVTNGDAAFARALIGLGADVDALDGNGATALMWAAHEADSAMVGELLAVGANVSKAGLEGTALAYALIGPAPESAIVPVVRQLLDAGVDVNVRDQYGRTAIFNAFGSAALTKALLDKGAKVDVIDVEGNNVLWFNAASQMPDEDRVAVAKLLLAHGADPTHENKVGTSPIEQAETSKHPEIVALYRAAVEAKK